MASVSKQSLLAATALTAATNTGTSYNTESLQTDYIAYQDVSACNVATTVASIIEHSPDGTNWFTLASFTNVVGTTGKEAVQITAHVFPWVRSSVTLSGVTKAATVAVSLYYDKKR